jgi:hypothetical protein
MVSNWNKFLIYSTVSLFSLFFLAKEVIPGEDNLVLETSMLHILQDIAEDRSKSVDLGIEKATLKKMVDPSEDFNFYRFKANIVIVNNGPGSLRNSQVVLSANDGSKKVFLKNRDHGFSLEPGERHIVDGMEVLFDGNYNGGTIDLDILPIRKNDPDLDNNRYILNVFEGAAQIKNISIDELQKPRNSFRIGYQLAHKDLEDDKLELLLSDQMTTDIDEDEKKYREIFSKREVYPYHLVKVSLDNILSGKWKTRSLDSYDPFRNFKPKYVFLKATDPESGNYAVSNILEFSERSDLTRGEFAKLFVEKTDVSMFEDIVELFSDVPAKSQYAPYIYSLHSYGLINAETDKFYPNQMVTRGEVVRIILDYYDIDLEVGKTAPHFVDVKEDNYLYPYIETVVTTGRASIFDDWFYIEEPATEYFLNYLLDAYRRSS